MNISPFLTSYWSQKLSNTNMLTQKPTPSKFVIEPIIWVTSYIWIYINYRYRMPGAHAHKLVLVVKHRHSHRVSHMNTSSSLSPLPSPWWRFAVALVQVGGRHIRCMIISPVTHHTTPTRTRSPHANTLAVYQSFLWMDHWNVHAYTSAGITHMHVCTRCIK